MLGYRLLNPTGSFCTEIMRAKGEPMQEKMRLRTGQYLMRTNEYVRQVCKTYDLARAAKGVLE